MTEPFKPEGFLKFELGSGELASRAQERLVCIPPDVLNADDARTAAREWGQLHGLSIVQESSGGDLEALRSQGIDFFVQYLSGVIAMLGWGSARIESWGPALVVVIRSLPLSHEIACGFIEGIMESLAGESIRAVSFDSGEEVRFLLLNPDAAQVAESEKKKGSGFVQIMDVLLGV